MYPFLFGALLFGFQATAQNLNEEQENQSSPSSSTVEEIVVVSCRPLISLSIVSAPYLRGQPAPLARIYRAPEYVSTERDEEPGVNTHTMPMTHRNTWGLNRKVITYSDIYYSPYR
jgi:hypothetical protein